MNQINPTDLLQPHLLETHILKDYLKQRQLAIKAIDNLSREEVLQIFLNYAVPMPSRCRPSSENKSTQNPNSSSAGSLKRNHHETRLHNDSISLENLTNCTKKIKLTNTNNISLTNENNFKRKMEKLEITPTTNATKRTKITWP